MDVNELRKGHFTLPIDSLLIPKLYDLMPADISSEPYKGKMKLIHGYRFEDGFLFIYEFKSGNEFAWYFSHPCDDIAPTLAEAEEQLANLITY